MTKPSKDYKSKVLKRLKGEKLAQTYMNTLIENGFQDAAIDCSLLSV